MPLALSAKAPYLLAKACEGAEGWRGFLVGLGFPGGKETPNFYFTTRLRAMPGMPPYKLVFKGRLR